MLSSDTIFSLVSIFINDGELVNDSSKKEKMNKCIQTVLQEIAQDYLHCIFSEKVYLSSNEKYLFTKLTKPIISMRNLLKDDCSVPFKMVNDGFTVDECGEYTVIYNYLPQIDVESGLITEFSPSLTDRVVSYGVAAEYLLLEGRYDEASLWDSRFRDGLKSAIRLYHPIKIKGKVWY